MAGSKNAIKSILGRSIARSLLKSAFFDNARIILMYHRVVEHVPEQLHDHAMYVTSSTLEMHINEISKFFEVVPLESVLSSGKGRLCAFTFDDGWLDNFQFAYPIFRNYRLPATIFIPAAMVGTERRFWFQTVWDLANHALRTGQQLELCKCLRSVVRWRTPEFTVESVSYLVSLLKKLDPARLDDVIADAGKLIGFKPNSTRHLLNWDEVFEMSRNGISFGSHGLTHNILPCMASDSKRDQIVHSFLQLRHRAIAFVPFFAYPDGQFDMESSSFVSRAGYRGAVTTRTGCNSARTSPYFLRRLSVHEHISNTPDLFAFRILQSFLT